MGFAIELCHVVELAKGFSSLSVYSCIMLEYDLIWELGVAPCPVLPAGTTRAEDGSVDIMPPKRARPGYPYVQLLDLLSCHACVWGIT